MALNIKDVETDRLVRELADLTGQPITVAVREAVQARLISERARRTAPDPGRRAILEAIAARGRQARILDPRNAEEILGYDDDGLPS